MWLNLVCQCAVRPPRSWVPICPAAVLCSSQWHNCAPCPTPWVPTFHSELKHAVPQPRYLDSKTLPPAVIWSSIPHCAITIIIMCAIPHPHLCFSSLALSLLLYHQSRVPPSPVLNSVCAYTVQTPYICTIGFYGSHCVTKMINSDAISFTGRITQAHTRTLYLKRTLLCNELTLALVWPTYMLCH